MLDIDKARSIRDEILRSSGTSDGNEVTWGKSVIDGVEHPCWRIDGDGWSATVSTLWDIMATAGRSPGLEEGDRFDLSRRHVIEVHAEPRGDRVMGLSYGEGDGEDHLFAFSPGRWEERFAFGMAVGESRRGDGRRGRFARQPGSGLRTASDRPLLRFQRSV